ncbi:response regulator [Halobacteriovorax vibrionivorans]|uniref:Response regulator n=1 Tax=Halobacteriovorax vibrionivorans TaxID=2152716 RepID=A0ABY0IIV2_9BACT|nr:MULTISPECIES: response regulator [Halobacteriovorax]RZF22877.1 response regulator [Halobacteriovorax vibrionivorans]TGD47330.1 response regulator [Halobacteriovorax sp. Y22]
MSRKVLVADDSQTIQKVIKITFASQDFELTPVLDEEDIFNQSEDFDLILLDFGLADDGYGLGRKVRERFSQTPILAMLGTFDIIDEEKLRSSGYSDKVVKPFETEKFINLCNDLIENGVSDEQPIEDSEEFPQEDSEDDNFSGWGVDTTQGEFEEEDQTGEFHLDDKQDIDSLENEETIDPSDLSSELDGWGFDPTNLKGSDVTGDFDSLPPVIEGQEISSENEAPDINQEAASTVLDVSNYFGSLDDELDDDFPQEEPIIEEPRSQYTSEELSAEEDATDESDDFPQEIADENLWDVDEEVSQAFSSPEEDEHEIDVSNASEMNDNFSFERTTTALVNKGASKQAPSVDMEDLKASLRADVAPIIEKYAKEYCEQNLEKIIWEIVPDLAENLIKKELKTISKKVLTSISE